MSIHGNRCILSLPGNKHVRLTGGKNEFEGRVEIYFKGIWGSVCDDDWDINDGHVACRMLGYVRALRVYCCSKYGPSASGRIFLDDVKCTGKEDSLVKCPRRAAGTHNCDVHRESAGVVCQAKSTSRSKYGLHIWM
jgi:deleted-in-malignant-brain-tumors protein 1